jgi:ketosteroid isomerase-like protein
VSISPHERRSPPWGRDTCAIAPWYDEPIAELEAAFREGEFPDDPRFLSEDAVFDWSRSISDNRGVHEGRQSLEAIFESFISAWDEVEWTVTSTEELDDGRLLVTTRVSGRGRDSGAEVEASGAQVWEFEDRRLTRATMFQSRDEAARELGLGS